VRDSPARFLFAERPPQKRSGWLAEPPQTKQATEKAGRRCVGCAVERLLMGQKSGAPFPGTPLLKGIRPN